LLQSPNLGELALVNSTYFELHPSISSDELELYFYSGRGGKGEIWVTTRPTINSPWQTPKNLFIGTCPCISYDGLMLYFNSFGGPDWRLIYVSRRNTTSSQWQTPTPLRMNINTGEVYGNPAISGDGQMLYFALVNLINGTRVDSRTDIYQVSMTPVLDFNRDGEINSEDSNILNSRLGEEGPSIAYLDIFPPPFGDGKIDERDLEVFLENSNKEYNLMAHWQFDETEGNIAHDRISGWNGLLNGGRVPGRNGNPIWASEGKINGALLFDGRNDYVSTPFVWNPSYGEFSFFAWVYGGKQGQAIISQKETRSSGGIWLGLSLERKLMTTLTDGGRAGVVLMSDLTIDENKWTHVGFVWNGSHRALYIDGKQVATDAMPLGKLEHSEGGLHFGTDKNLSSSSFWNGLIDEIRIYNKALNEREIRRLANVGEFKEVEGFETGVEPHDIGIQ